MLFEEIDTPAMLVDMQRVRDNIQRAQAYADKHGLKLRPHIKTHKLSWLAKLQLDAGACGLNCQKVSEADTIVEGLGPDVNADILLTFNIIGETKLRNLMALARKCTKLTVVGDSPEAIQGYAEAAAKHYKPGSGPVLHVMIECDTGGLRAGAVEPAKALALAKQIVAAGPALKFAGLMTFPAQGDIAGLSRWIAEARKLFAAADVPIPVISAGGTPDMWHAHEIEGLTEMRPGTYIYFDRATMRAKEMQPEWCAQTVLSTVVSNPTPLRAVCDAGSKALSSDVLGLSGFGYIIEYPDARIARISEEHGVIEADKPEDLPPIGARIQIVPNHACVVTNLFNEAHLIDQDGISVVPIPARGKMQ